MNKTELIEAVAAEAEVPKSTAAAVIDSLESVVTKAVKKGEKVAITGFVSFEKVKRGARTARNPQTGAEIKVPAGFAAKVSAGARFKAEVKGK